MRQDQRARALQEIATTPGNGGIEQPQSAEMTDSEESNVATILH